MAPPIVVIGGGTAGCTVVSHLASRTTREIVLVEPGGASPCDDVRGFHDVLARPELTRTIEVSIREGRPASPYLQACALGGGSAINGMVLSGEPPVGLAELTRLARTTDAGPVGRALMDCGGEPSRLWWNGGRWNPGRAVSHLAEEGRVSIRHAEASRVIEEGDHVDVLLADEVLGADTVVMCAGAIATPALLLASGFGAVNPAIGRGLQNHPVVSFVLHPREARSASGPSSVDQFDAAVVQRGLTRRGRPFLVIGYERASAADPHLGALSVVLLDVESRGRVSLEGGMPVVEFNVLSTANDRQAMVEAVRHLVSLVSMPAMVALAPEVSIDAAGTSPAHLASLSDDELATWIEANVGVVSHAAASCAAAVDPTGRLRGSRRIHLADASILPGAPTCTPAAPVTMEARRIAGHIGESLS